MPNCCRRRKRGRARARRCADSEETCGFRPRKLRAVACFEPISQRIAAKDSRGEPIFSQPPLAQRSASSSFTTMHCDRRANSGAGCRIHDRRGAEFGAVLPAFAAPSCLNALSPPHLHSAHGQISRKNFHEYRPKVVVVVPGKLDGVLAHAFRGERLGVRLEHQQRAGGRGRLDRRAGVPPWRARLRTWRTGRRRAGKRSCSARHGRRSIRYPRRCRW